MTDEPPVEWIWTHPESSAGLGVWNHGKWDRPLAGDSLRFAAAEKFGVWARVDLGREQVRGLRDFLTAWLGEDAPAVETPAPSLPCGVCGQPWNDGHGQPGDPCRPPKDTCECGHPWDQHSRHVGCVVRRAPGLYCECDKPAPEVSDTCRCGHPWTRHHEEGGCVAKVVGRRTPFTCRCMAEPPMTVQPKDTCECGHPWYHHSIYGGCVVRRAPGDGTCRCMEGPR